MNLRQVVAGLLICAMPSVALAQNCVPNFVESEVLPVKIDPSGGIANAELAPARQIAFSCAECPPMCHPLEIQRELHVRGSLRRE
jgi:hypothetical protein